MALKANKELKLYYSISEVAQMFGVNESLLRYWEKEFPMITPRKVGGNIRQYRKEDVDNIRLVYYLVKEKGMTLSGAKQRLKQNKETIIRNSEILERTGASSATISRVNRCLHYGADGYRTVIPRLKEGDHGEL